ncbi:MAG TPA: class I adenylate-forming enzyme family protein [Gemmataceae bacterium]|nr:class I adenylate-forming enzyme family protein [Gemmataceae bacterium]
MNLHDVFLQTVRRQPTHPAILGPGPSDALSYAQLADTIEAAAERLAWAGVGERHCVGVHCPSGADYIILNYAVWQCGGCVVPIPVELAPVEKQTICREIALDFVISGEKTMSFVAPFQPGAAADASRGFVVVPVTAPLEHPPGFHAINSAFLRFTSGTTGAAKGVVLSHETIHERIRAANEVLHIGPADRVIWLLSMSYHFAVSIVSYLSHGATVVLLPNHFAQAILQAANRHRATLMYGSPIQYGWLAACEPPAALEGMRLAISTTTGLDRTTAGSFRQRFGLPVTQALGIIEVGLPFINVDFAADRVEAVGRVLPAYRLRMDDVGLGPHLMEVVLSGPGFLDAYYQPWRDRSAIMPDGWFRTGDVGELDADGCLFLRGRTKDLIDVLGMKFFPQEVETVLLSHRRVAAVSVYGRRDARFGEIPVARVVVRGPGEAPSQDELIDYCRTRLAAFKVPESIEFVDALPRTASGKVLHRTTDS